MRSPSVVAQPTKKGGLNVSFGSDPGTYLFWRCVTCEALPGHPCEPREGEIFLIKFNSAHLDRQQKASFARIHAGVLPIPCPTCKARAMEVCSFQSVEPGRNRLVKVTSIEPCKERLKALHNALELGR